MMAVLSRPQAHYGNKYRRLAFNKRNEKNRNVKTHGKETVWATLAGDARLQGITHNYATRVSVTLRSHRFDCLTGRGHFWNRA